MHFEHNKFYDSSDLAKCRFLFCSSSSLFVLAKLARNLTHLNKHLIPFYYFKFSSLFVFFFFCPLWRTQKLQTLKNEFVLKKQTNKHIVNHGVADTHRSNFKFVCCRFIYFFSLVVARKSPNHLAVVLEWTVFLLSAFRVSMSIWLI